MPSFFYQSIYIQTHLFYLLFSFVLLAYFHQQGQQEPTKENNQNN
jgi:hypothetical protein